MTNISIIVNQLQRDRLYTATAYSDRKEAKERKKVALQLHKDQAKVLALLSTVAATLELAVHPEPATEKRADSGSLRTFDRSHLSAVFGYN